MNRSENPFMLFGLSGRERSWQGLRLLVGVYLGSLIFAAILAPCLYWLVQSLHDIFPKSFGYLAHKGFEDYFDRLRWVPVLICLPFLFIRCRLFSARQIGLHFDPKGRKALMRWFLIGCALLGSVAFVQYHYTPTLLNENVGLWAALGICLKALIGALTVAVLEETIFRGLILRLFYTAGGAFLALFIGSLFFAYAHFKMPDQVWKDAFPSEVTTEQISHYEAQFGHEPPQDLYRVKWWSGFFVAWWTIIGISVNFNLISFLTYFALAFALSMLTLRTSSLMQAIGLHAGIVFALLSYGKLADIQSDSLLLGGRDLRDGLLALGILVLLNLVICLTPQRSQSAYRPRKKF